MKIMSVSVTKSWSTRRRYALCCFVFNLSKCFAIVKFYQIGPPDEGFLHVCSAIDPGMSDELKEGVWTQVCTMLDKVDLDVSFS